MCRITTTIDLDDSAIKRAIEQVWAKEISPPDYKEVERPAHAEIRKQVSKYIGEMDLTDMIARVAREKLFPIVDKAVTDAITAAARKKTSEMMKSGTLFDVGVKNDTQ